MIYIKRLSFKFFVYIISILTINLLSNGQILNSEEENIDIPYQNINDDMTVTPDITKNSNSIYKRHTENDNDKKNNNEDLVNDSSTDIELDDTLTSNESIVENEENSDNKNTTISDSDENQSNNIENNDVENQDQLESMEDSKKNENTMKNHLLNRSKRVNKAGSSHKNRPSLNRVTSTKNKGNAEINSNKN